MDKRTPLFMPADKSFVKPCGLARQDARYDLNARFAKRFETAARNKRIRVLDRTDDAFDTGVNKRGGTRRRLAMMVVGLERNIGRPAQSFLTGLIEGDHLGMYDAVIFIRSLANYIARCGHDD